MPTRPATIGVPQRGLKVRALGPARPPALSEIGLNPEIQAFEVLLDLGAAHWDFPLGLIASRSILWGIAATSNHNKVRNEINYLEGILFNLKSPKRAARSLAAGAKPEGA